MKWPKLDCMPDVDITIVGLGPGQFEDITLAAWQTLHTASHLVLRTSRHPCVEVLADQLDIEKAQLKSFDHLYEEYEEFSDVYAQIAQDIVALARRSNGVVYAVPGHPWVGEATTPLILQQAEEFGLNVHVVGGISFVEPSFGAAKVDLMDGGQVVDSMLLCQQHHPKIDVGLPLLIGQLYARWLASDVKLTLLNAYPADHIVKFIQSAGTNAQRTCSVPLCELDYHDSLVQHPFDHLTTLYVPPLLEGGSLSDLQEIVAHLRAPEGCPWDQEQTLESLRQDLLGECVEVLEAIDVETTASQSESIDNSAHIAEELGDLLLVAMMMVQIATEEGRFQMADVTRGIVNKLIRRHPHVFGDLSVNGVDEIVDNWDAIKAQERATKGEVRQSPLDRIPSALPALEKAREMQSKAQKAHLLDRTSLAQTTSTRFEQFVSTPDEQSLGELLWAVVAKAKQHDLNPEDVLRSYVVNFRAQHSP